MINKQLDDICIDSTRTLTLVLNSYKTGESDMKVYMIKKACKWLENHKDDELTIEIFLKNFVNAMQD